MRLPEFAIKNSAFVLVLVVLAIVMGTLSYLTMPRSEDPQINLPISKVVAIYPGTSPEDLEEMVVDPLEERIKEVENVDQIRTTVQEGLVVLRIESFYGLDVDEQHDKIVSAVNEARDELPNELRKLEIEQITPKDVIIMQLAMMGSPEAKVSWRQLQERAEALEDRLEQVEGVRSV